jgi:hypothetical protein
LFLIAEIIDVGCSTDICPDGTFLFKVIEGCKPGVDGWLDVFKFRELVIETGYIVKHLFVLIVEIVEDDVGGWTDLDVFFLVGEIVVEVGLDLHGDLLVEADGDEDHSCNGET